MSGRKISRRATRFWRRLGQNWGARMAEQYGDECPPDWGYVIDRTDDLSLEQALVIVRSRHPSHPPTCGEFESCLPKREARGERNLVADLADEAIRRFPLCRHQLMAPWFYYGRTEEIPQARGGFERIPIPRGVVVPSCNCNEGGNPGYRLTVHELDRSGGPSRSGVYGEP